jgi:hypothetical protein
MSKKSKIVVLNKKQDVSTQVVIASIEKESAPLFKKLSVITKITTKEDFEKAGEAVKALKNLLTMAEDQKKKITDPANTIIKEARSLFKPFEEKVTNAETSIKLMMSDWWESNEKKKALLVDDFTNGKIKKESTYISKSVELEEKPSGAQLRNKTILVIEDEKKIPREYLVPNETAIKAALMAGKKVGGCKLEKTKTIAI